MDKVGGPLGVTAIAVVAALVVLLAILHFGFHVFRRRKGKGRSKSGVLNDSRVEVLESTVIDADRRLVLIRCDRIEHLIMVGGPSDVVVENDVRKVRGPGAPPAKVPGIEPEKRVPAAPRAAPPSAAAFEAAMTATPKAPEPHRPAARPSADVRQAPPRSLPAPQPSSSRASTRNGEAHSPAPTPRADEAARASLQRPQSVDPKSGRRDATPTRRLPAPPTPVGRTPEPIRAPSAPAASDRGARPVRTGGRTEPSSGLPAAQIPWSDPDSIENEIVRALRFDPQTRGDAAGRREAPSAKAMMDSHTTLGDLADKLEEALAREVQSASQARTDNVVDEFGFDSGTAPETERAKPSAAKDRLDKRERSEPQRGTLAPTPEAEARREPPAPTERREEAPVISLNSRRRETADQLEDEMARLLGELTSDTKGR